MPQTASLTLPLFSANWCHFRGKAGKAGFGKMAAMSSRPTADLPLHSGNAPRWLFQRMVDMAGAIVSLIVRDRGPGELLRNLSDPFWFQAFGCVLGFDW